ncbi:MAG: DUF1893 domain-containing protein [Oscillospiraceae bacterium]|nr:DUF1893 domain-containing protein [Oscillospiraceae bacterium]MDD4413147.1 DUF1893 domain-containing protein [Oscillospiraceae bacterium]
MSPELNKAKRRLLEGGFSFVLINRDKEYVSSLKGIAPIISLLENSPELLKGACVADKVIGKAAALLLIYGGVKEIFTQVISSHAITVLENEKKIIDFEKQVQYIVNRSGTGMCPMEKLVLEINDPLEGYRALS